MSTAEWLRAIDRFDLPAGWRLAGVGSRYDIQLGKMLNADRAAEPHASGAAPYLRNVNVQWGRIETADLKWMQFSADDRAKYALRRGDLLVCEGGEIGRCAIWDSDREGCFFQKALMRVRSRGPDSLDWLALCIRALADGGALSAGADKSTIDHLPAEKLRALRIPLAGPEEQREILRALAAETARMDDVINHRGRLSHLVSERARAAIDDALSTAPILRLKLGLKARPDYGAAELSIEGELGWPRFIRITDIDDRGQLRADNVRRLPPDSALPFMLGSGDILVARSGATVGKAFHFRSELHGAACFAGYLIRLRCDPDRLLPEYLALITQSGGWWRQVDEAIQQATIPNVSAARYADFMIPIPSVAAQRSVLARLAPRLVDHANVGAAIDGQIALLDERRRALITAAVTGKLQVPSTTTANAAA